MSASAWGTTQSPSLFAQQVLCEDSERHLHRLERVGKIRAGLLAALEAVDVLAVLGLKAAIDIGLYNIFIAKVWHFAQQL